MMAYLEPVKILIFNEKGLKGETSEGFGGFCSCGGEMTQKTWHYDGDLKILVAECENCWKTEALVFRDTNLIERVDVRTFKRNELDAFLSEILTQTEFSAVMSKWKNEDYNYTAYSRARKKLESMGLNLEQILSELIF